MKKMKAFLLLVLTYLIVPSIAWAQTYTYNGKKYDYKLSFHISIENNQEKEQDAVLYVSRNGFVTLQMEGHKEITLDIKNERCKVIRKKDSARTAVSLHALASGKEAYDNYTFLNLGNGILFSTVIATYEYPDSSFDFFLDIPEDMEEDMEDYSRFLFDDYKYRVATVYIDNKYLFTSDFTTENMDDKFLQIQEMCMLVEKGSFINVKREQEESHVTLSVGNDAQIYVGNYHVGDSSWNGPLENGVHTVVCKKDGHTTTTRTINVRKGKDNFFVLETPEPTTAKTKLILKYDSETGIYVDNQYKGRGTWIGTLPFGTHNVECRKDKHKTTKKEITITREGKNLFELTAPTPICGTLTVNTTPSGAAVSLDDKIIGYTPLIINDMLIGDYKLKISKNYFVAEQEDIVINENETTLKTYTLKSRVPVHINTIPRNVEFSMDGQSYNAPTMVQVPEGTYTLNFPRQYTNSQGLSKKVMTLPFDSLHLEHNIKLRRDNNYDYATFFGLDYDTQLQAIGVNFGSNPGKNFMFEMNFFYGLKKTETVYWTAMKTASLSNYDLQSFNYQHWVLDARLGPTFWCSPFLRISPEIGVQYLKLKEKAIGDSNTEEKMLTGGYISGIGAVRFRLALTQHFGLQVTPEYRLNITGKNVLPNVSKEVDNWITGFGMKAGIVYYFL